MEEAGGSGLHWQGLVDLHVHWAAVEEGEGVLEGVGFADALAQRRLVGLGEPGELAVLGHVVTVEQGVAGIDDVALQQAHPAWWACWNCGVRSMAPWAPR